VAGDFTIFMVHLLTIQHVTSASGSLVTGTRTKSKRRLHGTTTCLILYRSYFNNRCIRHYQTQFQHSRIHGANTAPITGTTEVLADSKPAASYTLAYLTARLSWMDGRLRIRKEMVQVLCITLNTLCKTTVYPQIACSLADD